MFGLRQGISVAKKDEKWKEFEQLVAEIYRQATPEATVKHNFFIVGKSGRRRQIDVSIESTQGLHTYFTVVECKRYARRVGIRDVEAFVTKIHDVRADKGVMVSVVGFDDGARAQAAQHNITLLSYREARETDWQNVADPASWQPLILEDFRPDYARLIFTDETTMKVAPDTLLTTEQEAFTGTAMEVAGSLIHSHPLLAPTAEAMQQRYPGSMWLEAAITTKHGPLFAPVDREKRRVARFLIQGVFSARSYPINAVFGAGHVLEDAITGERPYAEISTLPFSFHAIIQSQEGQELTREEYQAKRGVRILLPPEAIADNAELRLTVVLPKDEK